MKKLLFSIILIALGPGLFFFDGAIVQDFNLRSEQLRPALIPTTDRKCRSKVYLFHQCSFKYEINGQKIRQDYDFFALGAPKTLMLLKSSGSGVITSDVGMDYLWNRVLTISALSLLGLIVLYSAARRMTGLNPPSVTARNIGIDTPEAPSPRNHTVSGTSVGTPRRKAFGLR
ncbi:hypothetical protein [uncultured Roseibium sp.]|uniref:hypothetical protein n=1 Tax=uncultured Roseibium sp. TaxID=1936171 RepID=UPI0032165375